MKRTMVLVGLVGILAGVMIGCGSSTETEEVSAEASTGADAPTVVQAPVVVDLLVVMGGAPPGEIEGRPLQTVHDDVAHGYASKPLTVAVDLGERRMSGVSTWTTVNTHDALVNLMNLQFVHAVAYDKAIAEARAFVEANPFLAEAGLAATLDEWAAIPEAERQTQKQQVVIDDAYEVTLNLDKSGETWNATMSVKVVKAVMAEKLMEVARGWAMAPHASVTLNNSMFCGVDVSADGKTALITKGNTVALIDLAAAEISKELKGLEGDGAYEAFFVGDTRTIVMAGEARNVPSACKVDLSGPSVVATLPYPRGSRLMPDGSGVLSPADNGVVLRTWDDTEHPLDAGGKAMILGISPDGKRVAIRGPEKTTSVWDLTAGTKVVDLDPAGEIEKVTFSNDYSRIAGAAFMNRTTTIWDGTTGKTLHQLLGKAVGQLVLSADGSRLASSTWSRWFFNLVYVHDVESGELVAELGPLVKSPYALAFSPDGQTLVVPMAHDAMVHIWRLNEKE